LYACMVIIYSGTCMGRKVPDLLGVCGVTLHWGGSIVLWYFLVKVNYGLQY
jgi:hypothetical protein